MTTDDCLKKYLVDDAGINRYFDFSKGGSPLFCKNCGAQIADDAKFCDACGTQTATEQAEIQAQQAQNADAHVDKSMSGSVWITVAMAVFTLVIVLLFGFEDGEGMVVSITVIAFSVFICGLKWFYEIKAQKRWKKAAEEKAKGNGRHVL